MRIFQLELWSIVEKGTEFKKDCNFHQQVRFQLVNVFFSDDITHLNQLGLYLFGHVAGASPRGWLLESFSGGNKKTAADGNNQKNVLEQPEPGAWRTILHNWISASTQIWDRQKVNRSSWRIATVTLLHEIC